MNSPNNMNNCTYRSLMTSQVRSNEKFLLFSQGWAARQINATERNQTFRLTCIVFLTLLNTMLNHSGSGVRSRSSCVMRSRRSNFMFSFRRCDACFIVHFLSRTRKLCLKRHIYNKIEVKLIKIGHVNVILGHKVKTQRFLFW